MPLDADVAAETLAWFKKATTDLRAADHEVGVVPSLNTDIAQAIRMNRAMPKREKL